MPPDLQQALFAQFARFSVDQSMEYEDWEAIAAEFGVLKITKNTSLFASSWVFGNDKRLRSTRQFIRNVCEEDEDVAYGIMRRVYRSVGGADAEDLRKYPALQALENDSTEITYPRSAIRSDLFLDIDNVPGTFYPNLIENINSCYQLGIHDATLVLTRKILENLLIDILRRRYDTDRIELYYDADQSEFENFAQLIENFRKVLTDFEHYSGELDEQFIRELHSIRGPSNAEAHSIETNPSNTQMQKHQSRAEYLVKILFSVRECV